MSKGHRKCKKGPQEEERKRKGGSKRVREKDRQKEREKERKGVSNLKAVWEKKKKNNVSLLKNGRLDVLVISWNVGSLALLPNSYKKSFNLLLTLDNQKTQREKRKRKKE